jgi:hypothetical protein
MKFDIGDCLVIANEKVLGAELQNGEESLEDVVKNIDHTRKYTTILTSKYPNVSFIVLELFKEWMLVLVQNHKTHPYKLVCIPQLDGFKKI